MLGSFFNTLFHIYMFAYSREAGDCQGNTYDFMMAVYRGQYRAIFEFLWKVQSKLLVMGDFFKGHSFTSNIFIDIKMTPSPCVFLPLRHSLYPWILNCWFKNISSNFVSEKKTYQRCFTSILLQLLFYSLALWTFSP